jgi:Spy/CpxP family protein refolding chaperone
MTALRGTKLVFTIAALLVAGAAGAQAPAAAPPAGGYGFAGHRPPMERALGPMGGLMRFWNNPEIVEKLRLTDDQRKAMDDILQQHRETLIDMRANLEKAELALEPLMKADQPDEARVLAQIDQVAQARAELEKANARFLLAIRSKLTPDQWKQVQAFRANRQEMRRNFEPGRRGPGGQTPPPPAGPQGRLNDDPGFDAPAVSGIGAAQ